MTKLRLFSVTAILCLVTTFSMGQFTKQQANDLVLNQVLANQLAQVDVFSLADVQTEQSGLALYDNSTIAIPYDECWVYFVDDLPFANWNHSCRYVFVNSTNGNYTIINSRKHPDGWKVNFGIISEAQRPNTIEMLPNPNATINSLPPNPHMYAVIINGYDGDRYWRDVSSIFHTLINVYGYTKENIFVHYDLGYAALGNDLDGDELGDIDYNAYKTSIQKTFQELAGETNTIPEIPELGPDDQLFVYVTDHGDVSGGHSYIYLPLGQQLFDHEMANWVKNIKCAQMIYVMEQCYSGGFVDDIMDFTTYNVACKNRSIHTAANATEYSWAEVHITNAKYDEFVFYWTAAARGYYPVINQPWIPSQYSVGSFPFHNYPQLEGHPGDHNPDLNGDGFVQMEEAFAYADFMDTWSPNGYYKPYYSFEAEHPLNDNDIGFTTDLLTVAGYAGIISSNQVTEPRHYIAGGNITVNPSGSLTLSPQSTLNLGYGSHTLQIQPNANLVLQNHVQILGSYNNSIQVNGSMQIGQNVTFARTGASGSFGGLYLNNNALQTTFTGTTFSRSGFHNYGASLAMNNCTFNNCNWVYSHRGNVSVTNSHLTETWLYLENQANDPNLTVTVTGCTIANTNMHVGVDVLNYGKYFIENNNIKAGHNGIQIHNSGDGSSGNQSIALNNIHYCGWAGIMAYNVTGSFTNNNIHDNGFGIRLMNNCNVALFGNASAQTPSQTQRIKDNTSYEVYCSQFSFPWYFPYNVIIDEDNLDNTIDPLLYWDYPTGSRINQKDIRYNCWGNNFSAIEDLYPSAYFNYNPTWCPNGLLPPLDPIVDMFTSAVEQFENGNYSNAKNLFQLLIQQYPKSDYAQAAMKELLRLEEYVSSDYGSLKDYYRSNDSIVCDTLLNKLGDYLANQCDVKLENWQQAIHWFENKITNPSCLEDSIFAIIDLGYVYFLMENQGLKSAYVGNMVQFKPETKEKYFEHRDYLLSLLPGEMMNDKLRNDLTNLSSGSLLQNVPNPFAESTQIWYKVEKRVNVTISITDLTGKEIRKIKQGTKDKGTYKADFLNPNLTPGTYFYSLVLDGKKSDTKKMVIMR